MHRIQLYSGFRAVRNKSTKEIQAVKGRSHLILPAFLVTYRGYAPVALFLSLQLLCYPFTINIVKLPSFPSAEPLSYIDV